MNQLDYMKEAIKEAEFGIQNRHGGPFGAVIVKDDEIVGHGHNEVLNKNNPTYHGEIQAITSACQLLYTYDLSGCTLYTTAYPCPMCIFAMKWANIENVYYGCTKEETAGIGFRDNNFYSYVNDSIYGSLKIEQIGHSECLKLFDDYIQTNPTIY